MSDTANLGRMLDTASRLERDCYAHMKDLYDRVDLDDPLYRASELAYDLALSAYETLEYAYLSTMEATK